MIRGTKGKTFILLVALVLSLAFAGVASAATPRTIMKDGMELVYLRQAAEIYGYSVKWDGMEQSVTLIYTGKMMDNKMMDQKVMDDTKMDDKMMDDTKMDDKMMDDTKMDNGMKQVGQTIKVWIGSKKSMVDGKQVDLDAAPILDHNNTYVTAVLVTKYMKPSSMTE
ncbi:stalk domain-containing protein [Paenibacillus hodogayensis]|uniref:Stalk domain-containing protein n=1 Tax=Paenibacillus hodogayensis TaxID=279208 RepID=A0ABV5W803_9BACL